MPIYQPAGIQLHLVSGNKRMFYQEDTDLIAKICDDIDGHVFSRASIIIESALDVIAVPGDALIGISVMTDPLPEFYFKMEQTSKTMVTQISEETFLLGAIGSSCQKSSDKKGSSLSELEFVSGEHLFLELAEIAESALSERFALHHLFNHPSLFCRRLEGGFSIWNTKKIVSRGLTIPS